MYSGQIVTVRGQKYEVLKVNFTYGIVTCVKFNSADTKLVDFNFDELEG